MTGAKLPPVTRRRTGDGSTEFHVTALRDWDGFDALVRYLEKFWRGQVSESSDEVYSRRWVVRSGDVPITVRHDSQIGTFFLREDGVRDESLLERIADDLAQRLAAAD